MSDHLEHHGVKGMKWGVRKDKKTGGSKKGSKTSTSTQAAVDKVNLATAKKAENNPDKIFTMRTVNGKHDVKLTGSEFVTAMMVDKGYQPRKQLPIKLKPEHANYTPRKLTAADYRRRLGVQFAAGLMVTAGSSLVRQLLEG